MKNISKYLYCWRDSIKNFVGFYYCKKNCTFKSTLFPKLIFSTIFANSSLISSQNQQRTRTLKRINFDWSFRSISFATIKAYKLLLKCCLSNSFFLQIISKIVLVDWETKRENRNVLFLSTTYVSVWLILFRVFNF